MIIDYDICCKFYKTVLVFIVQTEKCVSSLPQFSQYLHENAAYVRPLEDSFLQLHQSITEDTVTVLVSDFGRKHCFSCL